MSSDDSLRTRVSTPKLFYKELKMPCSTQERSRIPPYEVGKPNP